MNSRTMKEPIANIFLFVTGKIIREIGAIWHRRSGTDEEKISFLQSKVYDDYRVVSKRRMPESCILVHADGRKEAGAISYETFKKLAGINNKMMEVLEDAIFSHCHNIPRNPVIVITPIVDGVVRIDGVVDISGEPIP